MSRKYFHPKKILWAFDPFEGLGETHISVAKVLSDLTSRLKVSIQPVYVLNLAAFNIPLVFNSAWLKEYLPSTLKAMTEALKDVPLEGLSPPRALIQRNPSLKQSVRALLTFAKTENVDLIVTGTHGKTGLKRVFLGSFAETLLLQSQIPVLTVNPSSHSTPIRHVLFPTDFEPQSKAAFNRLVELAKELGARITLLHVNPNPLGPVIQSGVYLLGGGWVPIEEYRRAVSDEDTKAGKSWIDEASKSGVTVKLVIDDKAMGVSAGIIAQAVRLKASLIAMAAESNQLSAAMLGSVTRQVVREAPCAVWILRQ